MGDELLRAPPALDQGLYRNHLEPVPLRHSAEFRESRHVSVFVHHFAQHTRRVEPRERRQIDRRLGVPGPPQHPPRVRRRGNTCPGLAKSPALAFGSIAARIVADLSNALIPVVVPSMRSIDTVKAVPSFAVLSRTIGGRSSSLDLSASSPDTRDPWRASRES